MLTGENKLKKNVCIKIVLIYYTETNGTTEFIAYRCNYYSKTINKTC